MTDLDRETTAAVEALAHRIRVRDAAIRNAEDYDDPEPFAREFLTALRGRSWRPVEALVRPRTEPGSGHPESEAALARVEQTRRELEAIRTRQREDRLRLAEEPPAGVA